MHLRSKSVALRALICTAVLLGLLASASPALASRAFLKPYITRYEAGQGEANRVEIFDSNVVMGGSKGSDTLEIADTVGITPQWGLFHAGGCATTTYLDADGVEQEASNRVWCAVEENQFEVSLGDEDDRFDMGPFSSAPSVRASVDGDAGNDLLYGGRASDLLHGGDGSDILRGRAGADRLSGGGLAGAGGADTAAYSERYTPVEVTIPEPPPPSTTPPSIVIDVEGGIGPGPRIEWPAVAGDDGAPGEGDDVQADIENVEGGLAGDTLMGSSAANVLRGNGGDDWLEGAGGGDQLDGGAGNDSLVGAAGQDSLHGGPGNDDLSGGSGSDVIYSQDGEVDKVDCGTGGSDWVQADPIDDIRNCGPDQVGFGG
jgi:Ca2+-binding RTX toxin-like protein